MGKMHVDASARQPLLGSWDLLDGSRTIPQLPVAATVCCTSVSSAADRWTRSAPASTRSEGAQNASYLRAHAELLPGRTHQGRIGDFAQSS
jgi:hypothetical protein